MNGESVSITFTVELPLDKEKEWKREYARRGQTYTRTETISNILQLFNEKVREAPYDRDLNYYQFANGAKVSFKVENTPVIDHEIKKRQSQAEEQLEKVSKSLNLIGGQINRIVLESARYSNMAVQPGSEWNEEIGPALWWDTVEAAQSEPAQWIGSPVDVDWPIFLQTTDAVFVPHPSIEVH